MTRGFEDIDRQGPKAGECKVVKYKLFLSLAGMPDVGCADLGRNHHSSLVFSVVAPDWL